MFMTTIQIKNIPDKQQISSYVVAVIVGYKINIL